MVPKADLVIIGVCVGVAVGILLASLGFFGIRWYKRRSHLRKCANDHGVSTLPIRQNGVDTSNILSESFPNSVTVKVSTYPAKSSLLSKWNRNAKEQLALASGLPRYSYKDIQKATKNFTTILGQGSFGPVYKATMPAGEIVAVKALASDSKQGEKEFQTEVSLLGRLHHRNLVNLVGYCVDKGQRMLIYEYMSNGSLASFLYSEERHALNWEERLQIALDISHGIEYLHDGAVPPVIHRDLKSANILLDHLTRAKGLGMRQELASDGGKRIVVAQPILEGLEEMEEEEDGLACMVCREGYSLRPTDLLGVYTFTKRVNLGVGTSGSTRGDCVYTTVSHFNIIHFQCHQEAKRADAALKNPKKEWDGAALRNNETLCNNLYPIRGPAVPIAQYTRYVDQYWDYLNSLGRADGSRLRLITYDIVLMLARFATGASFSTDSRGGGKESNAKFLPFMFQMAHYLLDHDSSQRNNLAKSVGSYLASSTPDSKSPTAASSVGTEETVQFMMVSSLLSESYESWLQHRRAFLQRGIYHAYMQRTHSRSTPRSTPGSKPDSLAKPEELLTIIQPMLVYTGLIEQLQRYFKVQKKSGPVDSKEASQTGENDEKELEGWEMAMKERLVNVKEIVGFSKEMLSWLDDMTSATDLQEAFDVIGVLADVMSSRSGKCEDFVYAAIDAGKG